MKQRKSIEETTRYTFREGTLSVVLNVLLFALKYWAGVITGSIAIVADAWHTLTDSLTSIIVIIAGKVSKKPADDKHPFGHGRAELISAFVIGIMLLLVAFDFIMESLQILKGHESANFGTIAVVVVSVSIVLKEIMAQYAFWAYRKTNSSVLRADGWHHRSDAISSGIILAGIFGGKYFWWIDGVLGLVVALLIGYAAYEIIKEAINSLLGQSPSPKLIQEITELCYEIYRQDVEAHNFHVHTYGNHTELIFHIRLPKEMSIREGHDIITQIEEEIRNRYGYYPTIHAEPRK